MTDEKRIPKVSLEDNKEEEKISMIVRAACELNKKPATKTLLLREQILHLIDGLVLTKCRKGKRIHLMDHLIKVGFPNLVKAAYKSFLKYDLTTDLSEPSSENFEHAFRPSFWLPYIVTPNQYVPITNYRDVTEFLCIALKVPEKVKIGDKLRTREEYLESVAAWKETQNKELAEKRTNTQYVGYVRYLPNNVFPPKASELLVSSGFPPKIPETPVEMQKNSAVDVQLTNSAATQNIEKPHIKNTSTCIIL